MTFPARALFRRAQEFPAARETVGGYDEDLTNTDLASWAQCEMGRHVCHRLGRPVHGRGPVEQVWGPSHIVRE